VPSPSSPKKFQPQQYASLPVVTPQPLRVPATTSVNVSPPAMGTGFSR
jgi:hypothetical protein